MSEQSSENQIKRKSYSPLSRQPLLSDDPADLNVPGVQVVYDPDDADDAGAFVEDALSYEDAWDANADLPVHEGDNSADAPVVEEDTDEEAEK